MSSDPAIQDYFPGATEPDNKAKTDGSMPGSDLPARGLYNNINLQLYHYAGNNPIIYNDPTGEFGILATAGIGALVGAVVGGAVEGFKAYAGGDRGSDLAKAIGTGIIKGAITGGVVGALGAAGGALMAGQASTVSLAPAALASATAKGTAAGTFVAGATISRMDGNGPVESLFNGATGALGGSLGAAATSRLGNELLREVAGGVIGSAIELGLQETPGVISQGATAVAEVIVDGTIAIAEGAQSLVDDAVNAFTDLADSVKSGRAFGISSFLSPAN